MIEIYLVRHGQTQTNLNRIVCGQMDTQMTELGYNQVGVVSKKLNNIRFNHKYSSPLIRARESAKYFDSIDGFTICDDLMEMDTGDYSQLTVDSLWSVESKLKYQGRFRYQTYPRGESLAVMYRRISMWFEQKLVEDWNEGDTVLVVGHEATVVCPIHYFLQIPLDNYPSVVIPNAGIIKILCDKSENQFRVSFL